MVSYCAAVCQIVVYCILPYRIRIYIYIGLYIIYIYYVLFHSVLFCILFGIVSYFIHVLMLCNTVLYCMSYRIGVYYFLLYYDVLFYIYNTLPKTKQYCFSLILSQF